MSEFKTIVVFVVLAGYMASCNTLEKASIHGLTSGGYLMRQRGEAPMDVYLDVTEEQIDVYRQSFGKPLKPVIFTISLKPGDSMSSREVVVKKQGLDVDITSILLKFRPSVKGLPAQLNTNLNLAVYAGWRRDFFRIRTSTDPLGKRYSRIRNLGYDFGVFAGPGTTAVGAFSTGNSRSDEYDGMVFQVGVAGFVESSMASFGLSIGYDHLLSPDRNVWIYRSKPWIGFIVGIGLK